MLPRLARLSSTLRSSQKPLLLYTARTPNGFKPAIYLEELRNAYGLEYDYHGISIPKNEQKEPWYININPNGRIPALTDRSRNNFQVFESAAILLYLSQHYDKEHKFSFEDPDRQSELLQWMFFAHGGIGPMQGQAGHFKRAAPEKIPYAINRYVEETHRLYGVLEIRLKNRDYLAGPGKGTYSIADINAYPWVRMHSVVDLETMDGFPGVKTWLERIAARPSVQSGLNVPPAPPS